MNVQGLLGIDNYRRLKELAQGMAGHLKFKENLLLLSICVQKIFPDVGNR